MRRVPVLAKTQHFLLQMKKSTDGIAGLSVGLVLPKRYAKRAVTRNAIRRQAYACIREWCLRKEGLVSLETGAYHILLRQRMAFSSQEFKSAWSHTLKVRVREELHILLDRL